MKSTTPLGAALFDPTADPYPVYRQLLAEPRLVPLPMISGWVASRWEDVRRVLSDRTFSADRSQSIFLRQMPATTGDPDLDRKLEVFDSLLLTLDPPDHSRLRRLVGSAFTPRRVEALAGRVEQITDGLLDELSAGETVDLVERLAYPLPVVVIAELLGLPPEDREDLKVWSDDVALLLDPFPPPEALQRFGDSIGHFRTYLEDQFALRRRHPGDDLIGALVAAQEGGDALDPEELFAMVVLLVAAGHETTTNLLANSVIALARYPRERERLTGGEVSAAVATEELLRYDSPVQRTSRVATVPLQVGEVTVQPGELVITVLGAANRDPAKFENPDVLDLGRADANQHLSFGHGIHFCLGAPLARLEARTALPALYRRFPRLEVDDEGVVWKSSMVLRGPERLPVTLS